MPVELKSHRAPSLVWVVFQSIVDTRIALHRYYCSPEFAHCWCYFADYPFGEGLLQPKMTSKLELNRLGFHVGVHPATPEQLTDEILKEDFVTDVVVCRPFVPPAPITIRTMTCVNVVKAMLGIHGWWVWTPAQLHRFLLHHHNQSLRGLTSWAE